MKFSKGKKIYSVPNGIGDGSAYFYDNKTVLANNLPLPYGSEPRTVSLWCRVTDFNTSDSAGDIWLFTYGADGVNKWYAIGLENKRLYLPIYGGYHLTSYELSALQWYHIVFTFDGNETHNVYVNGTLVETFILGNLNTTAKDDYICVGCNFRDVGYFHGNIKKLLVYNRALSAEEVTALYNKQEITSGRVLNVPLTYGKDNESLFSSKSFVYDYSTLTTSSGFDEWGYPIRYDVASECWIAFSNIPTKGLLTYVPFDGSSVTPTGEELTSNGIVTYGYDGKIPYVELSGSQIIQSDGANDWCYKGSPFAVSIWVKDVTSSSLQCAFSYGTGQKNKLFSVFVSNNKFCVQGSNDVNNEYHSPSNVLDGSKWTNIVVNQFGTYEDFYINGVKIGTFNWVREITNTDNVFVFGYEKDHSSYYSGKLSTFRYYNRVLTDKEIQQLAKEF